MVSQYPKYHVLILFYLLSSVYHLIKMMWKKDNHQYKPVVPSINAYMLFATPDISSMWTPCIHVPQNVRIFLCYHCIYHPCVTLCVCLRMLLHFCDCEDIYITACAYVSAFFYYDVNIIVFVTYVNIFLFDKSCSRLSGRPSARKVQKTWLPTEFEALKKSGLVFYYAINSL